MVAARLTTLVAVVLVASALVFAVLGGLLRAGAWPSSVLVTQAAVAHAALMMAGFLGTVIGIERAVAVKLRWAYAAPLASGAGGLLLLWGQQAGAAALWVAAASVFVAVNAVIVKRQAAAHTRLLLVSAIAWWLGNLCFAAGLESTQVLVWWFAFLVLTIAAERLEMTRLMRRQPGAQTALYAIVATLVSGAAATTIWPMAGGVLYGAALSALALWLGLFDLARRTVLTHGLSRYMAVCLLSGYTWLGVAGVAWASMALGLPARDLALHALGLGFIISMVMGHGPVILPAVAGIKIEFGPWFYAPLALLHASLLLRVVAGFADSGWRSTGALLNAAALALFAATVVASALLWRVRHGPSLPKRRRA